MNGLIAYFDILGYQSFLENNSGAESALKVLELITGIPKANAARLSEQWKANETGNMGEMAKEIANSLRHLIFSDTIVLSLPYPHAATDKWKENALAYIGLVSALLSAEMFDQGLPVRGALVEGTFVVKESCLAGKAVVEAYRMCESLDLASVVFSPDLSPRTREAFIGSSYERYFVHYMTPLKGLPEKRFLHLNWAAFLPEGVRTRFLSDISTFVLRSFWAHEKDCPLAVDQKIHNTQKLARRFAIAFDIPA
jgi:hypothetical protein